MSVGKSVKRKTRRKKVPTYLTSVDFLLIYKETELDQCFHPDIILESPEELKNYLSLRFSLTGLWRDIGICSLLKAPQVILMHSHDREPLDSMVSNGSSSGVLRF